MNSHLLYEPFLSHHQQYDLKIDNLIEIKIMSKLLLKP